MLRVSLPSLLVGVTAILVALVFTVGPGRPDGASGQAPDALQASFEMAIDANMENGDGPCDPIDDEASVEEGAVHKVAVCVVNPPEPPAAFLTRVVYDGKLNVAPEGQHILPALDDNPDANAGETSFSSPDLGARWDCSGFSIFPPTGDDEYTPEQFDAVLACNADLRNPDTTLVDGGPLEVITFEVIGKGDDHIEFDPQTQIGGAVGAIGRCDAEAPPDQAMTCRGAVIHKAGGAPPAEQTSQAEQATPEASPRGPTPAQSPAAPNVTPEGTPPAAAEVTSEDDDDGGVSWAVLGGALGGAAVLIVAVAGLYAWRRASRPPA